MAKTYDPSAIESSMYKKWEEKGYFKGVVDHDKKPYTIVIPPPNITGQLHMGHALNNTLQDIIIRTKRMQGYSALWVPGTGKTLKQTSCFSLVCRYLCSRVIRRNL